MRVVVVGAGIVGLVTGVALTREGQQVTVVDRDPGPNADGSWRRRGVMQFHHPHFFRSLLCSALREEMPDLWDAAVAAGGVPVSAPGAEDQLAGLRCRRETFEKALRGVAAAQPGLRLRTGHADRVVVERGRASGVVVDGEAVDAELVIDATGRRGRFADDLRPPAEGGECGFAYVSRMYRLRPGAEPGPTNAPPGAMAGYRGYLVIVFPHDAGTFSVLMIRASSDPDLALLRHRPAFEAATLAVPLLRAWTHPEQAEPITDVLPGVGLHNSYRGQLREDGEAVLPGLLFVGDSVCTTNPAAGRGASLGGLQALTLTRLIREHRGDSAACARAFDAWCTEHIRPWFDDHVYWDATLRYRWAHGNVDLTARIPSDLISAVAAVDPVVARAVRPFEAMAALPSSLAEVEPRAHAVLATGWRPPIPDGPTREELVEVITRTLAPAHHGDVPAA